MSFATNFSDKYGKKLWDADSKTGLDHAARTFSEKVVHKTAEATRKFIGNKIKKKKCETKANVKFWGNSYSTRQKTRNIEQIKTSIVNGTP